MRKILFRADAHTKIGTGDLVSLINLAEYFNRRKWVTSFLCRRTEIAEKILKDRGIKNVDFINYDSGIDEELKRIEFLASSQNIDVVFMEITERPLSDYNGLRGPFIKACVTFSAEIPNKFDVIIDWDIDAKRSKSCVDSSETIFLCGPEYVILPLDFDKKIIRSREYGASVNNILIFMGGCDEFDFTSKILKVISGSELGSEITVILGAGNPNFVKLKNEFSAVSGINFKRNISNMFNEYMKADVAISAGGIASFELIASRTPSLLIATYEHQNKRCEYFHRMKWATYLGFRDFNKDKLLRGLENPVPVPYLDFGNMDKLISTIEELHERRYSKAR